MPRFFFDTNDGSVFHRDAEGHEAADLVGARHMALQCLPDMARDKLTTDGDRRDFTVDIRNEARQVIYTVSLTMLARWFLEPDQVPG